MNLTKDILLFIRLFYPACKELKKPQTVMAFDIIQTRKLCRIDQVTWHLTWIHAIATFQN